MNVASEEVETQGASIEIFVSRQNLFEDAVDELLQDVTAAGGRDFSFPLNVQYIGEEAHDLGGPRREFLHTMVRLMKDLLLDENDDGCVLSKDIGKLHEGKKHYVMVGLLLGKCIISRADLWGTG